MGKLLDKFLEKFEKWSDDFFYNHTSTGAIIKLCMDIHNEAMEKEKAARQSIEATDNDCLDTCQDKQGMSTGDPIHQHDTDNESKNTDESRYKRQNHHFFNPFTDLLIFRPEWIHHVPTYLGNLKCTNRCCNCRQYADHKRKQRVLEFFYSFFGEQCQRTAIKQKKTVYRRLCKRTRRLVKNQRNPFIKSFIRIFVGNTHIPGKTNIKGQSFFLVHKQHSTKQDGGESIINDTTRQTGIERVLA